LNKRGKLKISGEFVIKEIPFRLNVPYVDLLCLRQAVSRVSLPRFTWDQLSKEKDDIHVVLYPKDSSTAIGCCLIRKVSDWLQLRQLAVDKDWQGRGLSKMLVEYFENYARRNGVSNLFIEARNTAVDRYLKRGYIQMPGELLNQDSGLTNVRLEKHLSADAP